MPDIGYSTRIRYIKGIRAKKKPFTHIFGLCHIDRIRPPIQTQNMGVTRLFTDVIHILAGVRKSNCGRMKNTASIMRHPSPTNRNVVFL